MSGLGDVPSTAPRLVLDLPVEWEQVPTEPEAYGAWIREAFNLTDVSGDDLHQIEAAFRAMLVEARGEGLVMTAGYLGVLGAEEDEDPSLLAANLFAAIRPPGNLTGVLSSFAWHAALREAEQHGDINPLKAAETVMLGEIEAVKSVVIDTLPADEHGPAVDNLTVTYYAGINDGATVLVLGFRTPCLWMAEEFEELFDRIAETVRIEADDTGPDSPDGGSGLGGTAEDLPST